MTLDAILEIMGGTNTFGQRVHSVADFMRISEEGMSVEVIRGIQERMGFTNKEMSKFLDISESTLHRYLRTENNTLKKDEAEKAYHISKVIAKGLDVFEEKEAFLDWLHTPNTALGGVKPIDWMPSSIGREQLLDLLVSIEYGMYS
jgi:putative toxin-antitoxin system antitoxin component (TIGR02293 family)